MGAHNSRNMDDDAVSTSTTSEDSDTEANYAEIFHRLINRYTNGRVIESIHDNRNQLYGPRPPKIKHRCCTNKLHASEIYFQTMKDSGINVVKSKNRNNISTMILDREKGRFVYDNFSHANKCKIANNYLPNTMSTLDIYHGKVFCGIFSKDGDYFITASQDQKIRLYKTSNREYELYKTIHARDVGWSIIDVAFSPNQEHFVYSTWSTSLHLCPVNGDPDDQQSLNLLTTSRRFCVFSLAFSSDGTEILGGANDGILYLYDLNRKQRSLHIEAHKFDVNTVAFADDSSHIIYSGSDDGLIKVWDRRTLGEDNIKPVGVLAGHMDGITYIDPKGDGRHLISNSKDQSIKLWDVRVFSSNGAAKNTLRAVNEQTWDYRWQGVPKKLFNIKDRLDGDTSVMTYRGHIITRTLIRCRFSPVETTGQRYIYTGCGGGRLVIYDALTGKIKKDEREHTGCVRDVAWHPYNNEILTSSWDGSVGRWYYEYKEPKDYRRFDTHEKRDSGIRRSVRLAKKKERERNNATDDNQVS